MAPLDWNRVFSVDLQSLENDEDAAERMFQILANADVSHTSPETTDPRNMIQLFNVARAVMMVVEILKKWAPPRRVTFKCPPVPDSHMSYQGSVMTRLFIKSFEHLANLINLLAVLHTR